MKDCTKCGGNGQWIRWSQRGQQIGNCPRCKGSGNEPSGCLGAYTLLLLPAASALATLAYALT